jgi:NhaC family Na+:H+ antiporter
VILGLSVEIKGDVNIATLLRDIESSFTVSGWLFIVLAVVIGFNYKKNLNPQHFFLAGTLLAAVLPYISSPTS